MKNQLEEKIRTAHLTKTEKRIADYLLEHSESLYFTTAKDLAQQLQISDTSIIRLCRSLGYSGYRQLQESVRSDLSQALQNERYIIPHEQVMDKFSRYKSLSSFQYLEMVISNLQSTYDKHDPVKFSKAAELILSSEHVLIAGFRGASSVAMHLSLLLSQFTNHISCCCKADSSCVEAMLDYGRNDCVVLIGVERYSKMTRVMAEMAREACCRLIVITDKITSSIANGADLVLLADFSSPYALNSFVGAMYVAETIAFEASRMLGIQPRTRLQRLNKYLAELELY